MYALAAQIRHINVMAAKLARQRRYEQCFAGAFVNYAVCLSMHACVASIGTPRSRYAYVFVYASSMHVLKKKPNTVCVCVC